MTRINRTNKDERDFYITPPEMCKALNNNYNIIGRVLDPCCGTGIMSRYIPITHQYDLFIDGKDFLLEEENWDVIVMNPPYKLKYKFIDKAISLAERVFVLLPLETSSYNIFVKNYLNTDRYRGRLLMSPKVFLGLTEELKPGGTTAYCWYEFGKSDSKIKYEIYDFLV